MSRAKSSGGETGAAAQAGRHAVLLFDGVCNLCNGWVDFVIRREPAGTMKCLLDAIGVIFKSADTAGELLAIDDGANNVSATLDQRRLSFRISR